MKKIIEYGIYLFAFLLPWQTRYFLLSASIKDGHFEYGSISLYLSDIILGLLLLLSVIYLFRKKVDVERVLKERLWLILAGLDLFAFLSLFAATDISIALYRYLLLLLAMFVFALILYFPYQKKYLIAVLVLALLVQAVFGIQQFISQSSPGNKWFGVSEHIPYESGVAVVEAMGNLGFGERWLRAYGGLEHPNILGAYLSLGLLFLVFYYSQKSKYLFTNKEQNEENRREIFKLNLLYYPLFLILFVALVFSFSRAAWLSFVLALFGFLFYKVFQKDLLTQKIVLPLLAYFGIMFFILSIPFGNLMEARILSKGGLERYSNYQRINSLVSSREVIEDNMLIGTGIGNYTIAFRDEYQPDQESYAYQPVHNTFLLIWSEIGIFGFLSFLFLLLYIAVYPYRKINIERTAMVLALSVLLFFDHWLWSLHFGILYLFLILAMILRYFGVEKDSGVVV